MDDFLIGIRLRATAAANDYRVTDDVALRVGDIALVEGKDGTGTSFGEVRRPRRPLPDFKRDRTFPLVDTASALKHVEAGHARGKVVITVTGKP